MKLRYIPQNKFKTKCSKCGEYIDLGAEKYWNEISGEYSKNYHKKCGDEILKGNTIPSSESKAEKQETIVVTQKQENTVPIYDFDSEWAESVIWARNQKANEDDLVAIALQYEHSKFELHLQERKEKFYECLLSKYGNII